MVAATAIRNTAVGAANQQKAEHVGGFEIDRRHAHCAAISSPSLLRAAGILPLTCMSQAGSGSRAPILAVGPLLRPARLPFRHQTGPEGANWMRPHLEAAALPLSVCHQQRRQGS